MNTLTEIYHICLSDLDIHESNRDIEIATCDIISKFAERIIEQRIYWSIDITRDPILVPQSCEQDLGINIGSHLIHMYRLQS